MKKRYVLLAAATLTACGLSYVLGSTAEAQGSIVFPLPRSYAACESGSTPIVAVTKLNERVVKTVGTPKFSWGGKSYMVRSCGGPGSQCARVELQSVVQHGTNWYACGNLIK